MSSITYKYWNFERKCFLESYDLIFWETEFPQPIDFEQPPAMVATTSPPSNGSSDGLSASPEPEHSRIIQDQIVVQPPPIGHTYATYRPLAETEPTSLSDAMSRPDYTS